MKPLVAAMFLTTFFPFFGNAADKLAVGAKLPAVTCNDQDGKAVDLAKAGAEGYLLVYFYPKASTPGCTKQGCSLRDAWAQLQKQGVNADNPWSLIGGIAVVVALAALVNWRYQVTKRRWAATGRTAPKA